MSCGYRKIQNMTEKDEGWKEHPSDEEEKTRLLRLKIALWYSRIHGAIGDLPSPNFKVIHVVLDEMAAAAQEQ